MPDRINISLLQAPSIHPRPRTAIHGHPDGLLGDNDPGRSSDLILQYFFRGVGAHVILRRQADNPTSCVRSTHEELIGRGVEGRHSKDRVSSVELV